MKTITIYTTPTCTYCKAAKTFFKANDLAYTEHDVAADREKAQEMITRSGQMGVPVIFIGDDMIVGFDEGRVRELVGIA